MSFLLSLSELAYCSREDCVASVDTIQARGYRVGPHISRPPHTLTRSKRRLYGSPLLVLLAEGVVVVDRIPALFV